MVSLGDDIRATLPFLRAQAESRFTERWDVYTTTRVLDGETGEYTDTEVLEYEGVAGQIKYPTLTVMEREQGGQIPATQDVIIKVAVGATPTVGVNDLWRCVSSDADPSLVGRTYRTKGEAQSGQVTAHRYPVERVS